MTHLLLWGNAYAQIIRNGRGEVMALYPLMPDRMAVDRDDKGQLYYEYTTSADDAPISKGSIVRLKPSDVLHIPGLGFDGLVGYSPIAMAKNAIGLAIATEEYRIPLSPHTTGSNKMVGIKQIPCLHTPKRDRNFILFVRKITNFALNKFV